MIQAITNIYKYITTYSPYFIIGNILLSFILLISLISTKLKLKKLLIRYKKFFKNSNESNIENLIDDNIDLCNNIINKNKEIENRINYMERNLFNCIQKVGVIRYNAFENVGSNLSFAIAVLDGNDNGFVINGIYSRDSTSTYAKAIIGGNSKHTLSAEEIQAIDLAKKSNR